MWSGPDIARNRPLVLGKYRLMAELGQGGMADVYLAASEGPAGFNKLIVIKRLRNLEDPQHMAMFLDEARIARRLSHPNIVQTYEIGQDSGVHFIVMEYLHGPTLQRLRRAAVSQRGVPWAVEIEIMCNVLEGLHYAHELRATDGRPLHVVHRDLSPENVIVTQLGECKILDFGIAKAIDSLSHTQAGFCKGKLKNMPPEQLLGEKVDRRADVFAAGVMLWEGLSSRPLWGNIGNAGIASRLAQGDLPALAELGPGVPQGLREICGRALAINPEGRFATALDFRDALVGYVQRNQLAVTRSQLAAFVEPLFAEERERIDRIVQGHGPGSDPAAPHPHLAIVEPPSVPGARTPQAAARTPATTPGGFAAGGTVALATDSIVPQRRKRSGGRRLGALAGGALLLALGGLGVARFTRTTRIAAEPPTAWVETPPAPAAARVPELSPPAESPPSAEPSTEEPSPAARATARHRSGGGNRSKPSGHARAANDPPRTAAESEPRRDPASRSRDLDRESPYGVTAPPAPPPKGKRAIDRNNPWPEGDPR